MAKVNQQAVEELKFYFDEVGTLTDNEYLVENPELLKERAESGDQGALAVYNAYLENIDKEPPQFTTQNAFTDFAQCFVEEIAGTYIAAIRGDLAEALVGTIQDGLWDEAVLLVAQIAGLSAQSVSVAANVAQLAAAGIICGFR